jgi:hypothetical protein
MRSSTLEDALPDLPRDLYITGKGGVGKSTIAQCIQEARGGNLYVMESRAAPPQAIVLSSQQAMEDCAAKAMRSRRIARFVLRPKPIRRFLGVTPGLTELCRLLVVLEGDAPRTVDLPATGHAIDWLSGPPKLKELVRASRGADMIQNLLVQWRTPQLSGLIVVTTPEPLVVAETRLLLAALERESPMAIAAVVINRGLTCSEETERTLESMSESGVAESQRALARVQSTREAVTEFQQYRTLVVGFDMELAQMRAA